MVFWNFHSIYKNKTNNTMKITFYKKKQKQHQSNAGPSHLPTLPVLLKQ